MTERARPDCRHRRGISAILPTVRGIEADARLRARHLVHTGIQRLGERVVFVGFAGEEHAHVLLGFDLSERAADALEDVVPASRNPSRPILGAC